MPPDKCKTCMVPSCKAINSTAPDRIFFAVPETKKKQWLEIVGADSDFNEPKKRLYCCEKHFSVKRDIVGYHFYKVFGGKVRLEDHAYPYRNLGDNVPVPRSRLPLTTAELPKAQKKVQKKVQKEDKQCDAELSMVQKEDKWRDESVDPLANDDENDSRDVSDDPDDTGFDISQNSDDEETKFDSSHRSEEIIVTSDVYMQDDDDYSDSDDIPLKPTKTEDNSKRDAHGNVKKDSEVGTSTNTKSNCPKCGKHLSSSRSLKRHVKTFHVDEKKRLISCRECRMVFVSKDEYLKHKIEHRKSFECDVCGKTFRTRFLLKSHYVQHVNEKPFLCEICSRPFARAATLQKHKYTHVTEKTHICENCGKGFTANFLLKIHVNQYHTILTTVMCASCSKTFSSTALLNIHIKAYHDEVNPYECTICKLNFKHPSALLRHRKRFHDPRSSYPCELCPKKFTKREMLERHMKKHPNRPMRTLDTKLEVKEKVIKPIEKPVFECKECGITLCRPDRPMRTLDTKLEVKEKVIKPIEKPVFECKECGITLCRPDRLRAHLANLHNPKNPHRCDTCRQTFPTEMLMSQHIMRSHAPEHEYIYKCYICPKKYNQEAALKRHVKLHTDPKKPVTCELCGKVLGRPNRLKPHMRALHNPDNPYKCNICLQTFREQKMLDSHTTQVHDQTILCQYCNKSFGKQEGLQQHLRRNHSELFATEKQIKLETVD